MARIHTVAGIMGLVVFCGMLTGIRPLWALSPPTNEATPADAAAPETLTLGERVWESAWDLQKGQSVVLGLSYTQSTLKFPYFRDDPDAMAQITDNGIISPMIKYNTEEDYFKTWELRSGRAALGYNVSFSYQRIL